jgi:hypothetical protein
MKIALSPLEKVRGVARFVDDSCRAEPQAPLTLRRAAEILGFA